MNVAAAAGEINQEVGQVFAFSKTGKLARRAQPNVYQALYSILAQCFKKLLGCLLGETDRVDFHF